MPFVGACTLLNSDDLVYTYIYICMYNTLSCALRFCKYSSNHNQPSKQNLRAWGWRRIAKDAVPLKGASAPQSLVSLPKVLDRVLLPCLQRVFLPSSARSPRRDRPQVASRIPRPPPRWTFTWLWVHACGLACFDFFLCMSDDDHDNCGR